MALRLSRRHFIGLAAVGVVAASVPAVARLLPDEGSGDGPPEIRYGGQVCDHCGMVIGEPRFAAAWRAADGSEKRFDDIGCMVESARQHHTMHGTALYVHDYDTEAWVDATAATYVMDADVHTPMEFGVVAFATEAVATERSTALGGSTASWANLLRDFKGRMHMS